MIKKSKTLLGISCKENLKEGKNINKKMSKKKLQLETSWSKTHKTPVRTIKMQIIAFSKLIFNFKKNIESPAHIVKILLNSI